jgi:hypothetical protein
VAPTGTFREIEITTTNIEKRMIATNLFLCLVIVAPLFVV